MAEYYAVTRSEEYLAHYGVKGMRWRVRKAIKSGNIKAYKRQEKKATKKLKRLEKQANSGAKYARKAIVKGAKVAATGGLVLAGLSNPNVLLYKAGVAGYNAYRAANTKNAAKKADMWRKEMEKEFNPGAIDFRRNKKRKRH